MKQNARLRGAPSSAGQVGQGRYRRELSIAENLLALTSYKSFHSIQIWFESKSRLPHRGTQQLSRASGHEALPALGLGAITGAEGC